MSVIKKYVTYAFVLVMFCATYKTRAAAALEKDELSNQESHARETDAALNAALYAAVKSCDCEAVEALLAQGANPSAPGERGRTAFGYAVTRVGLGDDSVLLAKKQRIVRALYRAGGDDPTVNIGDVLFLDTIDIVDCELTELYRSFYDLRGHDEDPLRSPMPAVLAELVRDYVGGFEMSLVPRHPLKLRRTRTQAENNASLLHPSFDMNMAIRALYLGADPDCKDAKGMTSLQHALYDMRRMDKAKLLLRHRANVNVQDSHGRTVLHCAAEHDYDEMVQLLLHNKANANAQDENGQTPLYHAARWGSEKSAQLLLQNKADIEARATDHYTPLHSAARNNRDTIVQLLLKNKANIRAQSEMGRTALHVAAVYANRHVMKSLLQSRADVDARDGGGLTPLHYAAQDEEPEIARLLLSYRADIEAIDNRNRTPLDRAKERKREKVIDLLFANGAVGEKPCSCVIA